MGETVFAEIGCASCHTPSLPLEDGSEAAAYTDVLLHDVAAADAGGVPDGDASYREFRTPPLWGVSQTGPYMHNGRAFSLEEAIGAHGLDGQFEVPPYFGAERDLLAALPPELRPDHRWLIIGGTRSVHLHLADYILTGA